MYTFIVFHIENQGGNSYSLDPRAPFNPWGIVCRFGFYWEEKAVRTVGTVWGLLKEAASNQPVITALDFFCCQAVLCNFLSYIHPS